MMISAIMNAIILTALLQGANLARCFGSIPALTETTFPTASLNANEIAICCEGIQPKHRSPQKFQTAEIEFTIDRLRDLQDVDQTITVSASLYVKWAVPVSTSCQIWPITDSPTQRQLISSPQGVWRPAIYFNNAVENIAMLDGAYTQRMEVILGQDEMQFHWKRLGVFHAVCYLDLAKFPFDTQDCHFDFQLAESADLVNFTNPRLLTGNLFKPSPTSGWQFVGSRLIQRTVTNRPAGDTVSQVLFYVTFKRRPEYFVMNLLAPCIVLAVLEMAAFLIPPNETDRICFSVYLVLALAVCQSQVLSAIPQTPQWVLLNYFIQLLGLGCVLSTAYAMAMFWFVTHASEMAKRQCGKISLVGFIEICFFFFFLILFIGVSVFSLKQGNLL